MVALAIAIESSNCGHLMVAFSLETSCLYYARSIELIIEFFD